MPWASDAEKLPTSDTTIHANNASAFLIESSLNRCCNKAHCPSLLATEVRDQLFSQLEYVGTRRSGRPAFVRIGMQARCTVYRGAHKVAAKEVKLNGGLIVRSQAVVQELDQFVAGSIRRCDAFEVQ